MEEDQLELAYRTAVPIDDVDYLSVSVTEGFVIVWVNISDRPDLAILSLQTPLPDGYSVLTWFYQSPGRNSMQACLRIEMKSPVRYAFTLVFPLVRYIDQLNRIARGGKIWIVPGPRPDDLKGMLVMTPASFMQRVISYSGMGLLITLEEHLVEELRLQLVRWNQMK